MQQPERHSLRIPALMVCALLALSGSIHAATEADVKTVGQQLVCYCGCPGLTVAACTCGTADEIREKIAGQLDSGLSTDDVVSVWVAERGEQILAVPTREGFNLVGWTMPFIAAILGLAFVTFMVLRWQKQAAPLAAEGPASSEDSEYLAQVEKEMKDLHR